MKNLGAAELDFVQELITDLEVTAEDIAAVLGDNALSVQEVMVVHSYLRGVRDTGIIMGGARKWHGMPGSPGRHLVTECSLALCGGGPFA
jgi:hypothetical protein